MMPTGGTDAARPSSPAFGDAARTWARIALLSFGGPAGQIAVMHRIVVDEKHWVGEVRFLHALNFCMLLPGPEAQQLATYLGWMMHGVRGGLVAGGLFILPGFVSILALSLAYVVFAGAVWLDGLFFGVKAAVIAIVLFALVRIARRALKTAAQRITAALAFIAIFAFAVPFPAVVIAALAAGLAFSRWRPRWFAASTHGDGADHREIVTPAGQPKPLFTLLAGGMIWLLPVAALLAILGPSNVFSEIALFFSGLSVVTFGGAYAALAWVAQEAAGPLGWLTIGEMLDGLGMAESTPGPLVQIVQFVAFLAAWREASGIQPWLAAVLASILATWVTFAPCFLWIFLGAPYVERLRGIAALSSALSAVTAAVVGVIANLALWFALHAVFAEVDRGEVGPLALVRPDGSSIDPAMATLAVLAVLGAFVMKLGPLRLIAICGTLGIVYALIGA